MAEDFRSDYGRYRDEDDDEEDLEFEEAIDAAANYEKAEDEVDDTADYGDEPAAQDHEARYDDDPERLDGAGHAGYGAERDTGVSREESASDRRFLTEAVHEALTEALGDPAVNESAADERIGRMKGTRRFQARARRQGGWVPPDLRRYGLPCFWPAEEPHVQGPARHTATDPFEVQYLVLRQVFMTPLVSCAEIAYANGLDEARVMEAARFLERRGFLRSVSFGCLMPRTARYCLTPGYVDAGSWNDYAPDIVSWHSDDAIGCLLRYDMPRVEAINQVAVRYVPGGWELEGVAWVDGDAVQAVGLYGWKRSPHIKGLVYFVWVSRWDTEQEVWERLTDLPDAASAIAEPSLPANVVLVGDDRWAVTGALPMAVERLKASGVAPSQIAAWTWAGGWQAASGASLLGGAARPFKPTLAPVEPERFAWPRSRRSLGRMKLETVMDGCPWTRRDCSTLYGFFTLVGEYPGGSTVHYAALRGKSEKDGTAWTSMGRLTELGLVTEAGIAGVVNLPASDRAQLLSERGQGRMRLRLSLSPQTEGMLADLAEKIEDLERKLAEAPAGESTEELAEKIEDLETKLGDLAKLAGLAVGQAGKSANGAYCLMLTHGHLSYREIVRRSGLIRLPDRLGDRRIHDDVLVDLLGRLCLLGCEVAPTSRVITVSLDGERIESDAVVYCSSPAGTGHHRLELERSHLGPKAVRDRLERYARQFSQYPLLVVCATNRGAGHFDSIGQELGIPVVATSIPRLREKGFSDPAWIHQGQDVSVGPVSCPPRPATPPPPPAAP